MVSFFLFFLGQAIPSRSYSEHENIREKKKEKTLLVVHPDRCTHIPAASDVLSWV